MGTINKTHQIGKFHFRFFAKTPTWCQVFLSEEPLSRECYLGGDSLEVIKERIVNKIKNINELPSKVKIKDRSVCWIISLMDGHSSVFLSNKKPYSFFVLLGDREVENSLEITVSDKEMASFLEFIKML